MCLDVGASIVAASVFDLRLEFADLGMEAVWRIEVVDFPAFVVVDNKGNDFFAETSSRHTSLGASIPTRT